jgi:hypothetical protein
MFNCLNLAEQLVPGEDRNDRKKMPFKLGRNKNNLRKLFPLLSIVCTSNSNQPIPGLPHTPELIELKPPSVDQAISIIIGPKAGDTTTTGSSSSSSSTNNRLTADQIGQIRQMLQQGEVNLVLGEIQAADILAGHTECSKSIDARLQKAEARCGADNIRLFCEFLCCSPCGLTSLELLDAFRLRNYTTGFMFEARHLGNLNGENVPFLYLASGRSQLNSNAHTQVCPCMPIE